MNTNKQTEDLAQRTREDAAHNAKLGHPTTGPDPVVLLRAVKALKATYEAIPPELQAISTEFYESYPHARELREYREAHADLMALLP